MRKLLLLVFGVLALLAGCATGVKHSAMESSMPALKADEGRIYFFRSSSMMGAAIQPDINLNGQVVGKSAPGGFFYVDRRAGNYEAAASTEMERKVSFNLDQGETKYIRTSISFGVMVGRINFELMNPSEAKPQLADLSYTGQ
jgi:hypothetical protein